MQITEGILKKVEEIVRSVAQFQLTHFRNVSRSAMDMKSAKETVSFVDVESEKMLLEGLADLVEGAGFYGEESGKTGSQDLVWIVDPLDGTTNYLNGVDHFSISVALVVKGVPTLGVICKPYTGDLFSAVRDGGMKFNGAEFSSDFKDVEAEQALFVTGFPYRSTDLRVGFFEAAADVLSLGLGIRRSGSAALDLANLAAGWYHGFWESDLQPYDVAAGMVMLGERGVVVTNEKGQPYQMFEDRLMVAAYPKVHSEMLEPIDKSYSALL